MIVFSCDCGLVIHARAGCPTLYLALRPSKASSTCWRLLAHASCVADTSTTPSLSTASALRHAAGCVTATSGGPSMSSRSACARARSCHGWWRALTADGAEARSKWDWVRGAHQLSDEHERRRRGRLRVSVRAVRRRYAAGMSSPGIRDACFRVRVASLMRESCASLAYGGAV